MTMSQENRSIFSDRGRHEESGSSETQKANVTKNVSFSPSDCYAWSPPGLTADQVENYFHQIPPFKVPRKGSAGETYRKLQLAYQIPDQDIDLKHCLFIEAQFVNRFYEISQHRSDRGLDFAYVYSVPDEQFPAVCRKCALKINQENVCVRADKFSDDEKGRVFHPACFVCSVCQELLVNLIYCVRNDQLYCLRHFSETFRPRCQTCDELILADESTRTLDGKEYHTEHFNCWQCDESLASKKYVLRDEHPYCVKCYEASFASPCDSCRKPIGVDCKDLAFKDKHWHEECFLCQRCAMSLVDHPFASKGDAMFCEACYEQQFSIRCEKCNEPFKSGTRKLDFKGKQWHENCFLCDGCQTPLGTQSFVPKNEATNLCVPCYEKNFADKCCKCNLSIAGAGVTFKNENWHKECFTCADCNTGLSGQRFTIRNEQCLCAECYATKFAKKCVGCTKAIVAAVSGSKMIAFEERNWHPDCFACTGCKENLVGKGFVADGLDILCAECAKTKLQ